MVVTSHHISHEFPDFGSWDYNLQQGWGLTNACNNFKFVGLKIFLGPYRNTHYGIICDPTVIIIILLLKSLLVSPMRNCPPVLDARYHRSLCSSVFSILLISKEFVCIWSVCWPWRMKNLGIFLYHA